MADGMGTETRSVATVTESEVQVTDSHADLIAEITRLREVLARISSLGPGESIDEAKRIANEGLEAEE